MGGQHGAVDELGLVVGEQALEPEHQRVVLAPLDARYLAAGLDLGEGSVERTPAGGAGRMSVEIRRERLARELLDALEIFRRWDRRGLLGHFGGVGHVEAAS